LLFGTKFARWLVIVIKAVLAYYRFYNISLFALSKKRNWQKTWLWVLIVFYLFLTCNDIIAAIFRKIKAIRPKTGFTFQSVIFLYDKKSIKQLN